MSSSSLNKIARPRFPQCAPDGRDGRGRDYYIKFDNDGYCDDQFKLKKKCDYEIPRYQNFHTLSHQTAPFKYSGNSAGRDTYVFPKYGFYHDQKSLCPYQLTDFPRNNHNANCIAENMKRKNYINSFEKDHNLKNRSIGKNLNKRLYESPINKNINYMKDKINADTCETELPMMYKACCNCDQKGGYTPMKTDEEKITSESCGERYRTKPRKDCYNNKLCVGLITRKKMIDAYKKFLNGRINYIEPENDLRFIDCRGKYSRTLNFFNYKPQLNNNKNKKFKIVP